MTPPASNAARGPEEQGSAAALASMAKALGEKKDSAGAIDAAKRALAMADCDPDLRIELGGVLAAAGAKPEAVACYLDAGTKFLYDVGDMNKARSAFALAHTADPSNLDVIFQMGQADVVEGRTQDALAKFIDVLRKSNLKHVPALFEAGCIYQSNGQYDQAILAFKKVLDRDKDHVQAIVHMGQLHQTKGMVPESLAYYLQAAEIAREHGQFGTAQQLLNMVLALDGGNQKARFMMDDLADRLKDAEPEDEMPAAAAEPALTPSPRVDTVAAAPAPSAAPSRSAAPAHGAAVKPAPSAAENPEIARSLEEARRALAELVAERDQAHRELDELGAMRLDAEAALARAKDEAEAAAAGKQKAADAKAAAEREAASVAGMIAERRAQLEEAIKRKADVEAEAASASAGLLAAKKSQSELDASAEKRREKLESEFAELAAKRAAAETEAKATAAALAAATAERDRVSAELKALTERRTAAAKSKATDEASAAESATAARAAADDLAAHRKELQVLLDRRAQASLEAETAEKSRETVRAEIAKAESTLEALRERIKTASTGAADAEKSKKANAQIKELEAAASEKLKSSIAKAKEAEAAASAAEADAARARAEAAELAKRKQEVDEAYARAKSLAAAAEAKRAESTAAAEQAEALRAKREADAEALAARVASLEDALKDADARAKLISGENAALEEVTAKVMAQRKTVLDLEEKKNALDAQSRDAQERLEAVRRDVDAANAALEAARAAGDAQSVGAAPSRRATDADIADMVAATVPPEACAESLRTIESLAAEAKIPFEIAAELAGLIHEGRAVEALRVCRARANLEAQPAPYLLASGDLARDLGDVVAAREAYRTLSAADPASTPTVHQRMGELFLTFADRGTAAALARDDAHFAAALEPALALEAYAELVARFPTDASFRQELGEVHERLGNADAAGLAYAQAMGFYLGSDDSAKAVDLVPRLLAVRAHSGDALELAARAYERAGKPKEAAHQLDAALAVYRELKSAGDVERVCRKLSEIAEDPVPYRRELAALLHEVGDAGGAAEQLVEAAERLVEWSNAADALSLLRDASAIAGDIEPLRERIASVKQRAIGAQGSVDDAARAAMFLSKKQYEKAAEAYRAAVDKNPYNADACYQLACLLSDHFPDYATAEQLLENAAELRPGHTATRYRLALVKAGRGDVEQAVELLVALARFDEHNADFIDQFVERLEKDADGGAVAAKYRLGIAYRELGRVEEALVILQSIQRESDFIVLCLNAIGLCLRRQGLDTAAAKRFQKAIETPGYPENQYNEALYNLGDLYETKHEPESLALSLSSFEELYARDCTYRDIADRIKGVKAKLGAVEGPKVKRLPTRSEAASDR